MNIPYLSKTLLITSVIIVAYILLPACAREQHQAEEPGSTIAIIPAPTKLMQGEGSFQLAAGAQISIPTEDASWAKPAEYLREQIRRATGYQIKVVQEAGTAIAFELDEKLTEPEAYQLIVEKDGITIRAGHSQGAFYGVQTLLQLLPPAIYSKDQLLKLPISIPSVEVEDSPRFAYRGMHLDVGRHFYGPQEVKRFIDLLALHKYNTFHWHLTEDQGWRIEIKKYPKLTEVGGFRKETLVGHYSDQPHQFDGKPYGGFYTQEEVKEIIAYAQDRFITIIPEIELPGHAQAAIAAYPELGCKEEKLEVMTLWGVSENVYCPTEYTFNFLEDVIDEVTQLFPSEYFHIGGDECPKKQWEESAFCQQLIREQGLKDEFELQSYFIKRVEKMLTARGKRLIGWDEILEGGLAPNATVMSWRGIAGGIEAAKEGHDVIMTPTSHCYLDYYQSQNEDEPLAIGGYLPIEKVYEFEPIPADLPADKQHHIIGAQANIWTEYIPNQAQLDYMTYPRACAMAEVLWSRKEQRNFQDFSGRLIEHFPRLNAYGVDAATRVFDPGGKIETANGIVKVSLSNLHSDHTLRYTLDGSAPTANSPQYEGPIEITETSTIKAANFLNGQQQGGIWRGYVQRHKGLGASINLTEAPAEKYGKGGSSTLINGVFGSDRRFSDREWLGFNGVDFEAVIDLGSPKQFKEISFRFFHDNNSWIYLPKGVKVYTSTDGKTYQEAGASSSIINDQKIAKPEIAIEANEAVQYVKILAENHGPIPEGRPGSGQVAWLFVGEIVID